MNMIIVADVRKWAYTKVIQKVLSLTQKEEP